VKARAAKGRGANRKGGASALRQRYETVMGAINESVYDWDIARDRFWTSESMQRLLGLPPGRLTLEGWRKSIHPNDYARFRDATIAHLKGETERFECDYRFRSGDGTWHWARTHGLAVRDRTGRAVRMVGSTGDITELKRTEQALKESEERHGLATRAATEGIYEWNVETGALFLSDRAREVGGFPPGPLKNTDWTARIHPDDLAGYRLAVIEHFKRRTPAVECEYRARDAAGNYRWVLDRGQAVRGPDGRAIRLIGAETDITQRKEALEQQKAIAEVLGVVTQLQTDVQPVFEAIGRNAARLCGALFSCVYRFDGELIHLVAIHNLPPAAQELARTMYPMRPDRSQLAGRAVLTRAVQRLEDVAQDGEYAKQVAVAGAWRRFLAVPMLREGKPLGVIGVGWRDPGPIPESRVELLKTFADQAVIAIEKVRLFNETREAFEQQKALAEVLGTISRSVADTKPVFDLILDSCQRLFEGHLVGMTLLDEDGMIRLGAYQGQNKEAMERVYPYPLGRDSGSGQAMLERRVVHFPDVDAPGAQAPPRVLDGSRAVGFKSIVFAPLCAEGRALGALWVARRLPVPFSEREIALLKTFADQAVIAIGNVRLFNETKEALEQQKAAGEVLHAISSSIADTAPVFDKILESCQRLFAGRIVGLNLVRDDGMLHIGAYHGAHRDEFERIFPIPVTPESGSGLSIVERRVVHYPDALNGAEVPERTRRGCTAIGIKSAMFAPVLWEGRGVGAIFVGRDHVSSFSEKEMALLRTFADQAAIAIENARLVKELEAASRHKSEFLANMSHELRTPLNAIIGFTRIVMRRSREVLEPKQYENLERILTSSEQLLGLINSILDLSKVEAGRVELHPGEVGLAPVLEQCMRTVEPLAKVALVKEFDGELPPMYVDEEKLRQIVINLLSNAVKFTERGAIRVKAQAANGSVAIAVCDTGIGIAPDKLELVFQEFEQADASSTRVYGGTGLGLAIARRLARLMGGDITAESVLGTGSTFRLTLPVRYGTPA
jgi:PAS domain S-box-containing protein